MSAKATIFLCMAAGSYLGTFIPEIFGANAISNSSLFGGLIGSAIGIYVGYRITRI